MNILHVVIGRPKREASNGVLKSVYHLAVCQGLLGHSVNVVGIRAKGSERSVEVSKNHKLHLFKLNKLRFLLDKDLRAFIALNYKDVDVVHFHSGYHPEYWCLSRLLRLYGIPYFISPRGSYQKVASKRNYLLKKLYKALFEMPLIAGSKNVHALNVQEASDIESYGVANSKIVTIPNGVDVENILKIRKGFVEDGRESQVGKFRLVYCGRIDIFYKGLDVLLDAIRLLVHERKQVGVQLRIIGPDWKGGKEAAETLVAKYKVSDNVMFLGAKYGKEKYALYASSNAFILPSRTEGMPTSVLEAMVFGLPCIVTPESNIDRAIMELGGCVFVELSTEEIADAVENFMANERALASVALTGQTWTKKNYNYMDIAEKHLVHYKKC